MEGAAQTILSNAVQLLTEEYRQLRGVGGEVAELRNDLETMNALLIMLSEAEDGAVDRFVQAWMNQLRELAYDSEDCVDLYRLRIKSRPSDSVRDLLGTLFPRRRLAGDVRALRARATAIGERHARYYGINREALMRAVALAAHPVLLSASASTAQALRRRSSNDDDDDTAGDSVTSSAPPVEPSASASASASTAHALRPSSNDDHTAGGGRQQFVALGDQAETLVKKLQLLEDHKKSDTNKVLSIVGFGGVGKTTLAMELCRQLEAKFPYQAVVSVSQAFEPSRDMKALLKRVLQQVVKSKTENERGFKEEGNLGGMDALNQEQLADKLKEFLNDKRYLIVVDDVWSIHAWEQIQPWLPETNGGSKLIVTTRIVSVAKQCSSAGYIHEMQPLSLDDSKELFLSRVFGSTNAKYPEELNDVVNKILKKCGGLPLAIVSIASILAGYKSAGSRDKWDSVCKSIGSQMESHPTLEGMRHIVTLSYNHLPHELKSCMMYLSIFPEDYEIDKGRLLRRWIAEGLVPEKRGFTPLEVADLYLDELVSRNMVVPQFGFDGKVESCRVHDILLEVMMCKSLECNFVSLLGGQYAGMSYGRIRRLSIHGDDDAAKAAVGKKKQKRKEKMMEGVEVEHVRSLSMFQVQKGRRLLDHLDKFALLRVLDLEDCEALTNDHMKSVCRLYLLRYLSVRRTNISKLPRQVGKLKHLQTLDACETLMDRLPETVTSLEKLELLKFSNKTSWYTTWTLPRGISKMKALRHVGLSTLKDDIKVAEELCELQNLRSFDVYVDFEADSPVIPVLVKSLGKLHSLRRLGASHCNMESGDMNFLCRLPAPPRLLRSLWIEGAVLNQLPNWVGSLTYLAVFSITLAGLTGDQLFGVLYKLPNLKSIWMGQRCYSDEKIVARTSYGDSEIVVAGTSHNFPALTDLWVACDETSLPKVFEFQKESMPKLEKLKMNFTDVPRSIVGIEHLTGLKEVELTGEENNGSLQAALDLLKEENSKRSQKFQVVVKYV